MKNVFVGEDIILPRSLRSQNAHPYVAKTKNLYLVRRGDLNVFEENLSACHAVARLFGVRAKAP